ncbi:MAG: glycosyltransferase [Myxococcota bacterium]
MHRSDVVDKTVEPGGPSQESGLLPRGARSRIGHVAIIATEVAGALGLSIERAFESLGRQVTFIPYADWLPTIDGQRGMNIISRGIAGVGRPVAEMRLVAALGKAKPDLVLLVKCDDLHLAAYAALRRTVSCPIVAFHPDDPWNIGTTLRPGSAHRRATLQVRTVDVMLLWSRALVDRALNEGAQRVFYFPFACDPDLHGAVTDLSAEERRELGAPITFIGSWEDEREMWLGAIADAGLPLAIWGPDQWQTRVKHPKVKAAYRGRPLFGREHAAAIAASDVNLSILRRQNKNATSMRTFEIPCMGGFMLHERSLELPQFFRPGEACDDFVTKDELVEKCRRWLEDEPGRKAVAAEGLRRANMFTYREWVTKLMDRVAHLVPDQPPVPVPPRP